MSNDEVHVTTTTSNKMKDLIRIRAAEEKTTVAGYVRRLIEKDLDAQKEKA